jgi:transmembrane sensor
MEPRNPATEAAEWLATLTDPSCTEDERQRFVEWLRRSNLHVDEFLRISSLAKRLTRSKIWPRDQIEALIAQATAPDGNTVAQLPASSRHRGSADQTAKRETEWPVRAIDRTRRESVTRTDDEGAHSPTQRLRWAAAVAVAALIAAVALAFVRFDPFAWQSDTYTTAIGELRSITLEDGSVVDLNTSSTLRTHFTSKQRTVELLRGEAVFKVAKNPQRPFRVATGSTEIVAVGTQFNVYARDARTVVTVLEGRVRVTDKAPSNRPATTAALSNLPLELSPGEQAVIAPHRPIARIKLADATPVTSWTERRLIFEDTPLSAAADEFARYNTRMIRIDDPVLRDLRVTGVFDATDPASLVQFVEAYGNVSVSRHDEGWTLSPVRP